MGWLERAEAHQREHSRRRVGERFGLKLTRNLRGTILADIRRGRAEFLADSSSGPGRQVWLVTLRGRGREQRARVVYDPRTGQIVTVMRASRML